MVGVLRTDCRAGPGKFPESHAVELNPEGVDEDYLRSVNLCFGDPWDGSAYRWYLRREFAGRLPDLLVVRHPGEMVAGLGLNYRQVRLAGGALVEVGIVTAAWTLPAARGRGCLEALLRGSVRIAAQRGCVLLLAFVTRENGSSGVMRRCGSTMIPTAYLRSSPKDRRLRVDCKSLVLTAVDATEVETSFACRKAESAARFDYSRSQDWGDLNTSSDPTRWRRSPRANQRSSWRRWATRIVWCC
ncbi:MAG: hypothetical protein DMH00_09175 [Acidobacteria bacterium]|nr:MAG: hypothetical protein DMH00_09175 [Acidobacteriota bacterium]